MITDMQKRQMEKTKHIYKVYSKVLKKFKSIELGELKMLYLQDLDKYAELSAGEYGSFIVIGRKFFSLGKREMGAVIAHELGHYKKIRHYSHDRFIITNLRDEELVSYAKQGKNLPETYNHRFERLKKWCLLHEIDADNKAAKAGYGKPILNILISFAKAYEHKELHHILKEQIDDRIKNLEEKLRA